MQGALRVKPETADPDFYLGHEQVYVDAEDGLRRFHVSDWSTQAAEWVLALRGLESRDAAEKLKGGELLLDETALKPLGEGEYFQHDLAGCDVFDEQGRYLGRVVGVMEAAGQALLDVRDGKRALTLPMIEAVVLSVDISARRIVVRPPPGLLE